MHINAAVSARTSETLSFPHASLFLNHAFHQVLIVLGGQDKVAQDESDKKNAIGQVELEVDVLKVAESHAKLWVVFAAEET